MDREKITVPIGCDHAGYALKEKIKSSLERLNFQVKDFGTDSPESVDYPDFVHPLCKYLENNPEELGVLICGSANGVAITANKHQHIRAAICWNEDLARLAREHNNANVLALPARFIEPELAIQLVNIFLKTEFQGGRHARRVNKMKVC